MSLIGRIFGTGKAPEELVEGLSKGIGALVYTKQEKANDQESAFESARRAFIQFHLATTGENLARTVIAFTIAGIWALSLICQNVFVVIAIFVPGTALAGELREAADTLRSNLSEVHMYFSVVLGFYFTIPHIPGIVSAIKRKEK